MWRSPGSFPPNVGLNVRTKLTTALWFQDSSDDQTRLYSSRSIRQLPCKRSCNAMHAGISQSKTSWPHATLQEKLRGCGHLRPQDSHNGILTWIYTRLTQGCHFKSLEWQHSKIFNDMKHLSRQLNFYLFQRCHCACVGSSRSVQKRYISVAEFKNVRNQTVASFFSVTL